MNVKRQSVKPLKWRKLGQPYRLFQKYLYDRETCISLLAEAGVDDRLVKKIVGHKGQGVTQQVYTHFEIQALLDAINKI